MYGDGVSTWTDPKSKKLVVQVRLPGIGHYYFKHGYFDPDMDVMNEPRLAPFEAFRRFLATGEQPFLIY